MNLPLARASSCPPASWNLYSISPLPHTCTFMAASAHPSGSGCIGDHASYLFTMVFQPEPRCVQVAIATLSSLAGEPKVRLPHFSLLIVLVPGTSQSLLLTFFVVSISPVKQRLLSAQRCYPSFRTNAEPLVQFWYPRVVMQQVILLWQLRKGWTAREWTPCMLNLLPSHCPLCSKPRISTSKAMYHGWQTPRRGWVCRRADRVAAGTVRVDDWVGWGRSGYTRGRVGAVCPDVVLAGIGCLA